MIQGLLAGIGIGMAIMGVWAWCCITKFDRGEK